MIIIFQQIFPFSIFVFAPLLYFLSYETTKGQGPFKVTVKLWRVSVETILPDVRMGPKSYQIICGTKYQYWTIFGSHSVLVMAST